MTIGDIAGCALLAALAGLAMLCLRLRAPLGADEGYLWFGVQQLLKGRLPHRDFRSYEPGRYLWCAAWARVSDAGLGALRASTHLFFVLALALALLALRRLHLDWTSVAAAAIALTALAHPQHKQFEHGLLLLSWATLAQLLLAPSVATLAWASGFVGLVLLFGFNLFLYCAVALAVTLGVAVTSGAIPITLANVATVAGAGLLGLAPFGLFLAMPGFARTFYRRRIHGVLARGEANLSLPAPWPWRAVPKQFQGLDRARQRACQWLYLALLAVPLAVAPLAWLTLDPTRLAGVLPACALGLFVFHHAASRADAPHLTQSLGPLCLLAILGADALAPAASLVIAAAALWLVWPLQPWVQRRRTPAHFCRRDVDGLAIDFRLGEARLLDAATALCARRADADNRGVFVAPAYPALYSLLGRDAPVYDTFSLYAADARAQQDMIDGIERAGVHAALVSDAPFDGREELRFSRTHPQVWAHLQAGFASQARPDLGRDVFVLTRPA